MLKNIPFYASLLGRDMAGGKKANNGLVLVYGAIEVHAMGDRGCIASNGLIGKETGLSAGTVANYISLLSQSGWVKVNLDDNTGKNKVRLSIEPLLIVALPPPSPTSDTLHLQMIPPSSTDDTPLHTQMKREDSKEYSENTSITNVIGETPETFGNADINEMFEYWELTVGYKIDANRQRNRNACSNLLKKYKDGGLKQLINAVQVAHTDTYAPRISDFVSLQSKLNDLLAWAKKKGTSNATAQF